MSAGQASLRVHRLVEYIKSVEFALETDEVAECGASGVLKNHFGIEIQLSPDELALLHEELMRLAELNEMREAQVKLQELFPEDSGVMLVRQNSKCGKERSTTYQLPFSYPVDENLRIVAPSGASFPILAKKKPL